MKNQIPNSFPYNSQSPNIPQMMQQQIHNNNPMLYGQTPFQGIHQYSNKFPQIIQNQTNQVMPNQKQMCYNQIARKISKQNVFPMFQTPQKHIANQSKKGRHKTSMVQPQQQGFVDFNQQNNGQINSSLNKGFENQITQVMRNINDDDLEFFFKILDCKGKTKEEKEKYLICGILPNILPQFFPHYLYLLNHLKQAEKKLKEPFIPMIFNRTNSNIHYFLLPINLSGIDLKIPQKDNNYICIGMFLSPFLNQNVPINSLFLDGKEVNDITFGSNEKYFMISNNLSLSTKIRINFLPITNTNLNYLTWFIVQIVEKKTISVITQEICNIFNLRLNDNCLYTKTDKCKDCSFQFINVIEDYFKTGSSVCPSCGVEIFISNLIFIKNRINEEPNPPVVEEDNKLVNSRNFLGNTLGRCFDISENENKWYETTFIDCGLENGEYKPLEYNDSSDFIEKLFCID